MLVLFAVCLGAQAQSVNPTKNETKPKPVAAKSSQQEKETKPKPMATQSSQQDKDTQDDARIPSPVTPLSVCTERASSNYSECYARGIYTKDTCDAFYQQSVNNCFVMYGK